MVGLTVCLLLFLAAPVRPASFYIMNTPVDVYATTVDVGEFLFPDEYGRVLEAYRGGRYRLAILALNELVDVGLPDGRMDTYLFVTAECYHQLKLDKFAARYYRQLLDEYPAGPYCASAAYRLFEDAYTRGDESGAARYRDVLETRFASTPLGQAGRFIEGKRLYKGRQFAESDRVLAQIPAASALYTPATFVRSLCALQANNYEKAVLQMDLVIRTTGNLELRDEAILALAEIYHRLKKQDPAVDLLRKVGAGSSHYNAALLLLSQFTYKAGDLEAARKTAETLLLSGGEATLFEAAMVLEAVYMRIREARKIDTLRLFLENVVRRKKIVFDLYRELDLLTDIQARFTFFCQDLSEQYATLEARRKVSAAFEDYTARINGLKERYLELLSGMDRAGYVVGSSGIYEIRYLEHLDRQSALLTRQADSAANALTLYMAQSEGRTPEGEKALMAAREALLGRLRQVQELKDDIRTFCLTENLYVKSTEDIQAKFVDWNMIHLSEMKNRLLEVYREISGIQKEEARKAKKAAETAAPKPPPPAQAQPDSLKAAPITPDSLKAAPVTSDSLKTAPAKPDSAVAPVPPKAPAAPPQAPPKKRKAGTP